MECCDVRTNSLKQYHRECTKNSVEKMHVDVGASRITHMIKGAAMSVTLFAIFLES